MSAEQNLVSVLNFTRTANRKMPVPVVEGGNFTTIRKTITTAETTVTTAFPGKTFHIKAFGQNIELKRNSTDSWDDSYLIHNGESIGFALKLTHNTDDGGITIGTFRTVRDSATLFIIVGY